MNHLHHFLEYRYLYLSEIDIGYLEIEGVSLMVMIYENHLPTIEIMGA